MSEKMSVNKRTIERDLAALQKNNILKRQGSDKTGSWIIIGESGIE